MSNSLYAYKRLLKSTPKVEHSADLQGSSVFQSYLAKEKFYFTELFVNPELLKALGQASDRQDKYNQLYGQYRDILRLSQELFDLKG
ncbi:unnamed protein product [Blepharisma stoltei]|uniref:Uncharacterized protein n=1 Tax=Blepharisma stoltei TaxID=1481888 RepID=A0AAU9IMH1_9CILI|nr:unnamed protein product [Blepharisma stoltei]